VETVTYPSNKVSLSCGVSSVVALLVAGTGDRSVRNASRGSKPIVTNSLLSLAPVCGATNTLVDKNPKKPMVHLRFRTFLRINSDYFPCTFNRLTFLMETKYFLVKR
jgi:hypothetical protein